MCGGDDVASEGRNRHHQRAKECFSMASFKDMDSQRKAQPDRLYATGRDDSRALFLWIPDGGFSG